MFEKWWFNYQEEKVFDGAWPKLTTRSAAEDAWDAALDKALSRLDDAKTDNYSHNDGVESAKEQIKNLKHE